MKFYKTLITLLMLFVFTSAFTQKNIHPQKLVEEAKQTEIFQTLSLFTPKAHDKNKVIEAGKTISEFSLLNLEKQSLQDLFQTAPDHIQLQLPRHEKSILEIELVKVDIFADGFQVIQSSTNAPVNVNLGLHYRGIIKGSNQSFASISIFENSLMGLVSSSAGNYVLGKLKGQASDENTYILYNDKEVLNEIGLSCDTPDDDYIYSREELTTEVLGDKDLDNCTRLYLEVDHDIFLNKGGISNTTNYITGLFNQVATLYSTESMNTEISEIFIWNTSSPYSGGSSSSMLSQFQNLRTDFNGDLGELFSYQSSGGIAAGFSGICNSNRSQSLCFSSIGSTYQAVPTYSWTIMVATHELGHLFGSRHTHACVWNGNGTAIDGCSGFTEGNCFLPNDPPAGGTIMSYCHLSNVGINFSLGFGTQPGNVIRNVIDNADCLVACGGGGNDDPCDQNVLTFSITLDERGYETTWEILDEDGNVVFEGGPYEEADETVITESICLNNGCYTFAIYDSGNNGLCCRNGFGHFTLTADIDGSVLASGSRFFGSQVTPFCVEGGDGDGGDGGGDGGGGDDCTDNDLALFITLDNFGSQTTWTLSDDNGNLLYEGGPYANNMSGTVIEESLCVVDDCFNFSIFDSAGNGLSGNGSYFLVDPNSNVILQGGSFGAVESTDFCYPDMGGGDDGDCNAIDFSNYSIDSYADDDGSGNAIDNGIGIRVANDAWKSISFNYTVTPNTKIKFSFRSLKQGEVHGIGFDDDNIESPDKTFQIYGTEDWGIDVNTYNPTNWVTYIIPVGQYYTGSFDRMFFIAAKEGRRNQCNSYFQNVYVYEGDECDDAGSLSGLGAPIMAQDLIVYPNPVTSKLKVSLGSESDQRVSIQVFNLVGQKVLQSEDFLIKGRNTLSLNAKMLEAGTYILKIGSGEDLKTTKFVKQ